MTSVLVGVFSAGCTEGPAPKPGDAAPPTSDAGCTCTTGDGGPDGAEVSLACFCDGTFGDCPSYEDALADCSGALPESSRLEEYAGCNYALISSGGGFGGRTYVYDYTTHQIVGASRLSDSTSFTCGDDRVFGYRAGAYPDATCARTNVVTRCTRDGGDAAATDVQGGD
jgi:hypothetical protein